MHHSVHPHIRGAYVILLNRSSPKPGSSPHTWGIQELGGADQDRLRFIPTYVGHTMLGQIVNHILTVHPHIRGAYSLLRCHSSGGFGSSPHTWGIRQDTHGRPEDSGSSPHTWGIRPLRLLPVHDARFIPTYVGHTPESCWFAVKDSVHPHIRGAYPVRGLEAEPRDGSSPHTWGILRMEAPQEAIRRFIPTYVGHTENPHRLLHIIPVHPHIRGAYLFVKGCPNWPAGSSPHTWGILEEQRKLRGKKTVHPHIRGAYGRSWPVPGPAPVHPHIRGAYSPLVTATTCKLGSSPHTWGIPVKSLSNRAETRFIPTYVGHTETLQDLHIITPVHPHIRGAYCLIASFS